MRSGNRGGRRSGNVSRRDHDGDRRRTGRDGYVRLNGGVAAVRTQRNTDSAGCGRTGQHDRSGCLASTVDRRGRYRKA